MSRIDVLYSAVTETFEFQENDLSPDYVDIFAGIKKHVDVILFNNLSFGYELKKNEQVISSKTWPEPGVVYLETDQEILDGDRVNWEPSTEYKLIVWFNNWGQHYSGEHVIITPDPIPYNIPDNMPDDLELS